MYTPQKSPSCRAHAGQQPQRGSRTISVHVSVGGGHSAWRSAVHARHRNTISAREAPRQSSSSTQEVPYGAILHGFGLEMECGAGGGGGGGASGGCGVLGSGSDNGESGSQCADRQRDGR